MDEENFSLPSRYKRYLKVNIISLFFIAVSFISITLAWFAYSGLASAQLDVNVKAWYIEFEKDDSTVSNNIVISLPDISPGMDTINEIVKIKNLGDSDASLNYKVTSARIFDQEIVSDSDGVTADELEDMISHDFPVHVNINLNKHYARTEEESIFDVSISWPLDSGLDELDSEWGKKAYDFQVVEEGKKALDANYQVRPAIKIEITITAEQYTESVTASDFNYNLGDLVIYDVVNNRGCESISANCILTHVIDVNSTLGDSTVALLPDVYNTYVTDNYNNYDAALTSLTSSWNVEIRNLMVGDLIKIISTDVLNSVIERNFLSDSIVGKYSGEERLEIELAKAINSNGLFKYDNEKFSYLSSNKCYWTSSNYNDDKAFAFKKYSENKGMIYGESKEESCSIIPVIIAPKSNL